MRLLLRLNFLNVNEFIRLHEIKPQFSRLDTSDCFQWRVRNLPYEESTYNISIDASDNKIVIRTTNKKYYKRFGIPEMDVLKMKLDIDDVSWYHRNNALVISVRKQHERFSLWNLTA